MYMFISIPPIQSKRNENFGERREKKEEKRPRYAAILKTIHKIIYIIVSVYCFQ